MGSDVTSRERVSKLSSWHQWCAKTRAHPGWSQNHTFELWCWESLGLQGDPTSPFWRRSALGFLWKEWYWSWNSSTLATSCKELTHWKRLWCWEGVGAGGEGDDRGWDGWMASLTWWTLVSVNSRSWWWTGRLGVLWFMGSQRVGQDWATDLIWSEGLSVSFFLSFFLFWSFFVWENLGLTFLWLNISLSQGIYT